MLAQVTLTPPFAQDFFGGVEALEVAAGNIFQLVSALDAIGPGFAEVAPLRAAFAIDGMLTADWASALTPASEVLVIPRVAGG